MGRCTWRSWSPHWATLLISQQAVPVLLALSNQIQILASGLFSSLILCRWIFFFKIRFESGMLVCSYLLLRDIMPVIYVLINLFDLAYDSYLILHYLIPQILLTFFTRYCSILLKLPWRAKGHSFEYNGLPSLCVYLALKRPNILYGFSGAHRLGVIFR